MPNSGKASGKPPAVKKKASGAAKAPSKKTAASKDASVKAASKAPAKKKAASTPRRAGLLQERSRQTRRRLVRSALQLWSERGFENGIEDTTVEEIAAAAGVTKGTFYFHFSHKEQILVEMGYQTADLLNVEADRLVESGADLVEALRVLIRVIERQITAAPPGAVVRALGEFRRRPTTAPDYLPPSPNFKEAFGKIFAVGQSQGLVTDELEPDQVAGVLQALVLDSIGDWGLEGGAILPKLEERTAIVLAGVQPGGKLTL
jgi:AcrR family transcriptional regulator